MPEAPDARPKKPQISSFCGRYRLSIPMTVGAFLFCGSALAQEPAPTTRAAASPFCKVFAFEDSKGKPKQLHARCPNSGLVLGRITAFEAETNEDLKATLVDAHLDTSRRILLLTVQDDGRPLVQDLGGQIALAAGRGPSSDIDGIELDFKQFARTGDIGVRGRPEDRGRAKADRISVSTNIALMRALRSNKSAQN